jgi:hypothetical protein
LQEIKRSMESGACFDSTGAYRYCLWRIWASEAPRLAFVMLNPSTADAEVNDATIRRCLGFAQRWGYGSLEVVNLFALRTPHPQQLRQVAEPVGAECDAFILAAVARAERVVLGWGNWGKLYGRDRAVLDLLIHSAMTHPTMTHPTMTHPTMTHAPNLYCLGCNQSGQPRHPLYLKREVQPVPYGWREQTQSRISALT